MGKSSTKILRDFQIQQITCLKYLSNGYVASGSSDGTVNIWNPKTWSSIQKYSEHTSYVLNLDQIDNDTMVSGSYDQTIRIWKISTNETLRIINVNPTAYSVRVLSNEFQVVCGFNGTKDNLKIYNYFTNQLVQTLDGHIDSVSSLEILNEQFIASGGYDKKVIIWDLYTYSIQYNLSKHLTHVTCLKRLSSSLIASSDASGLILVWNYLQGTLVYKLIGHTGALGFSSLDLFDDQTLISGSYDQTVKFWNISNGQLIQTIKTNIQIRALTMLKAGKTFVIFL